MRFTEWTSAGSLRQPRFRGLRDDKDPADVVREDASAEAFRRLGPCPPPPPTSTLLTRLLGRTPRADFDVVVRTATGDPLVIRNAPLLVDGTPMPTRYWLVDPEVSRAVAQLESAGGVRRAEAAVDADALRAAHAAYAAERDAALDPTRTPGRARRAASAGPAPA